MTQSILQRIATGEQAAIADCLTKYGGLVWSIARKMLRNSDAILSLVGEGDMSPWVRSELENAVACEKPAFALVPPGSASAGIPQQVTTFEVNAKEWSAWSISALRSIGKIDEA